MTLDSKIKALRNKFTWPSEKPTVPKNGHGWLAPTTSGMLQAHISDDTKLIVELGSWMGLSTRFLCEHTNAHVICIDHWQGSPEHSRPSIAPLLPTLYETFLVNCWEFRHRITPVRTDTITGIKELKHLGEDVDLVYVDASHDTKSVIDDVNACLECFPRAVLVGDDYNKKSVKEAIRALRLEVETNKSAWSYTPPAF